MAKELSKERLPRAARTWGGADVVISKTQPKTAEGGFYPDPRRVVTDYALELSWVFEALKNAFYGESRLDGCSKIDFFGRLANAANRYLQRSTAPTAHLLCAAVLHEAFAIYDEMEKGTFQDLAVARGNEIADDHVDEARRTGYSHTDSTLAFFRSRGVEVKQD